MDRLEWLNLSLDFEDEAPTLLGIDLLRLEEVPDELRRDIQDEGIVVYERTRSRRAKQQSRARSIVWLRRSMFPRTIRSPSMEPSNASSSHSSCSGRRSSGSWLARGSKHGAPNPPCVKLTASAGSPMSKPGSISWKTAISPRTPIARHSRWRSTGAYRRIARQCEGRSKACGSAKPERYSIARTISSVIFLASPNSIMVLSLKNSSFSMPA
jgi:hypothetical protein